ncbi:MAG: GAF domain-containing protein [Caldilineaceae bacterium]|nr:GAF domain-containing protein [Caldilineaceae bacterium]
MTHFYHRLSTKFVLALLLFLFILGTATAAVITTGFRQTQFNATQRSIQGLQYQGRETLLQVTLREAQISDIRLSEALNLAVIAANYFQATRVGDHADHLSLGPLAYTENGARYDPNPARLTEVWVDPSVTLTPESESNLRVSLMLDELFPAMLSKSSDAIAIYYIDPQGATRYYPVVDIAEKIPPDLVITEGIFFRIAAPDANPQRQPVWTDPYVDFVGQGPIATAAVPIYDGDTFLGVISLDISLTKLIERLNALTPTPGSYALLIDKDGDLVAAPPEALRDLLNEDVYANIQASLAGDESTEHFIANTLGLSLDQVRSMPFLQTLADMRRGASGLAEFELNNRQVYLAYALLPSTGWSLAVMAPIEEITAESQAVATAIQADANTTVRWTLLIITIFFGMVLMGTAIFIHRFLTRPIAELVTATQTVAAGDLSVSLPIYAQDELGQLADSFNRMTNQIVQMQQTLEQRVMDRTRDLSALYAVTAVASRSLDQDRVLANSLDRVLEVMACDYGAFHLWDAEEKKLEMAIQQRVPTAIVNYLQKSPDEIGLVRWVVDHGKPLVIADLAQDPRVIKTGVADHVSGHSYVGVPMCIKNRILGVLSIVGEKGHTFGPEEVVLLTTIADQVGVAVENARLYGQAEQLAVIEERQRLARELHDSVTQSLYSVNLMAETARRTATAGDLDRTRYLIDRSGEMARQALKEMRLLVYELRPAALAQEGLIGALQQRIETVEIRAGVKSRLLVEGDPTLLPPSIETSFYRIAQEALNNALKHAEATEVTVSVAINSAEANLIIKDNGKGFDPSIAREQGGIGLKSMQERTEQLAGQFTLHSSPGEGAAVHVCLPIQPQSTYETTRERP